MLFATRPKPESLAIKTVESALGENFTRTARVTGRYLFRDTDGDVRRWTELVCGVAGDIDRRTFAVLVYKRRSAMRLEEFAISLPAGRTPTAREAQLLGACPT